MKQITAYLSKIKETIKFKIKDQKQLLEMYPRFNTNGNYPGAVQVWGNFGPSIEHSDPYNEFYFKYESNTDKVDIKFHSDFGMSSFNFDKFFEDTCNADDIGIQQKFLDFLGELFDLGIVEFELE